MNPMSPPQISNSIEQQQQKKMKPLLMVTVIPIIAIMTFSSTDLVDIYKSLNSVNLPWFKII